MRKRTFGGAIGYLADSGDMDFNLGQRTAVFSQDRVSWHVGAVIGAQAHAEREYRLCLEKARAVQLAMTLEEANDV